MQLCLVCKWQSYPMSETVYCGELLSVVFAEWFSFSTLLLWFEGISFLWISGLPEIPGKYETPSQTKPVHLFPHTCTNSDKYYSNTFIAQIYCWIYPGYAKGDLHTEWRDAGQSQPSWLRCYVGCCCCITMSGAINQPETFKAWKPEWKIWVFVSIRRMYLYKRPLPNLAATLCIV